MSLSGLFPTFPAERVLLDDGWLVAIDKPAGISTHAPDEGRSDDAFSRLGSWLAERGILVAPGDFYGAEGAEHVRIAFTATDERIAAAVRRLRGR